MEQVYQNYLKIFTRVNAEYIAKLVLHTGINIALTFPWALAYQTANDRHQILTDLGQCYGVRGTVEMEDVSLNRLWWGRWLLPLVLAIVGMVNYGLFRLYISYGHPWKFLLKSDKERIKEWKGLKFWEFVTNYDNLTEEEGFPLLSQSNGFNHENTAIVNNESVTKYINKEHIVAGQKEKENPLPSRRKLPEIATQSEESQKALKKHTEATSVETEVVISSKGIVTHHL